MKIPLPHRTAALLIALALGPLASPPTAHATVMVRRSVDELAARADLVVVASVRRASAQWIGDRIYTDVEVTATEVARGDARVGASLVVRTPGGIVGNEGQRLAGAPVLEPGQRYVLFLRRGRDATYETVGLSQGVLPVREPPVPTAPPVVLPAQTDDLALVDPPTGSTGPTGPRIVVPREGMALDRFLTALRAR